MSFLEGSSLSTLEGNEVQKRKQQQQQQQQQQQPRQGRSSRRLLRIVTMGLAGRKKDEREGGREVGLPLLGGGLLGEGLKKKMGRGLIEKMSEAWGYMLWNCDCFQADPHP